MSNPPYSWTLRCSWCPYSIVVSPRGARSADPGAGIEAADCMKEHVALRHGRTWLEFLAEPEWNEMPA